MKDFIYEKIQATINHLHTLILIDTVPIEEMEMIRAGYKKDERPPMPDCSWEKLRYSQCIDEVDAHYWIYKKLKTPARTNSNYRIYLDFRTSLENYWYATNPQCLLYLNGQLVQGLDREHTDALLEFGTEYDIQLNMYTGTECKPFLFQASLKTLDAVIESIYYDFLVPFESLGLLNPKSDEYLTTLKHLELACNILDLRVAYSNEFYESIEECAKYLKTEYYEKECGKSEAVVSCIGHTHIDVAWRWTLAQTEEKAQHSFSTVLKLFEEYPEFRFMSSQPQLYEYVKLYEPELYERIRKKVAEGKFEPEGAMWLEADCNLSSGESLIRQIIFGKKFFRDEFGIDSKILWLPDVFGYSAALPQILKKSGVDKFVTSKISWNEQNTLPYDIFMWEGLDGTEIFTSFITDQPYDPKNSDICYTTYVGDITPAEAIGSHYRQQQKKYTNKSVITFGWGDGGGGPTRKMLEYYRRMKYGLPGVPKVVIESAKEYLDKLENDFITNAEKYKKIPRWVGELYLEFHRGTYTSVAKNKRNNRCCEILMQNVEQLSTVSNMICGMGYPKEEINQNWKMILLNQFHDIIPGSSIKEVYEDSDLQYAQIKQTGKKLLNDALSIIAEGVDKEKGMIVYNPNSFETDGYVETEGKIGYVGTVPSLGWKAVNDIDYSNKITIDEKFIENQYYIIDFDDNYNICSLYDKRHDRQVVKFGCVANQLEAFEDIPYQFDNWELSSYYKQKKWNINDVSGFEIISEGARAGYKITRKFLDSEFIQKIYVYDNSPRIDFVTKIEWKQEHIVVKSAFPLDIHADKAVYETQFGYVERPTHENTSWDAAKFEVCAHKYADISEDDYGVAILNDCKYGHNAEGSTLKLTLLKCGTDPWKDADKGTHEFTYSLLPHSGNHKQGRVIQEAYKLNRPFIAMKAEGDGSISDAFSLVECNKENVIIETVKKAENCDAVVIRAYDSYNRKGEVEFKFGFDISEAYICDLMENKLDKIEVIDNRAISVNISNFEIVTIMVR